MPIGGGGSILFANLSLGDSVKEMIRLQMKCRHAALPAYRMIMNVRENPVDVPDLRKINGGTACVDKTVSIMSISFMVSG